MNRPRRSWAAATTAGLAPTLSVKGTAQPLLDGPSPAHPEVAVRLP
ncbi:hypothetical protein ACWD0J_04785 [Streptomyces sp. NPDC003011]